MSLFTDQLNRKLELQSVPRRIISLVPSQTELLYDLGLRDEVVGITKFCVHPAEWFRSKMRVGGTKKYDFEKIQLLAPDLIIGNKEENEQQQMEMLMSKYPVWMSDIYTLNDALDMITNVGEIVERSLLANQLKLKIETEFALLEKFKIQLPAMRPKKVAYFIWRQPFMVAGGNTFINNLLECCGFKNVFSSDEFMRYPEITAKQLEQADPDIILLSSEPYPFKEKHLMEFKNICKNAAVYTVDGELFSWYGSRLIQAPSYFINLIKIMQ